MTDETRSRIMRSIGSRDTCPERAIRTVVRSLGLRFRVNVEGLPGKPDLAGMADRWAIFVNGCFWHDHGCKARPVSNRGFWDAKLDRNVLRDAVASDALKRAGWRVLPVWECEIRSGLATTKVRRFLSRRSGR